MAIGSRSCCILAAVVISEPVGTTKNGSGREAVADGLITTASVW